MTAASAQDAAVPPPLLIGLSVSLVAHLALLGVRLASMPAQPHELRDKPLHVVYQYEAMAQRVRALQQQLTQMTQRPDALPSASAPTPQIRIPDRGTLGLPTMRSGGSGGASLGSADADTASRSEAARAGAGMALSAAGPGAANRSPVVDLANLLEAAQGDPILLSYFGVIRDQIQQTANHRVWLTAPPSAQGIVYLSFVLARSGQTSGVAVLTDRSVESSQLQQAALSIVRAAGPFPPFPPSLPDAAKTIVVPLEFLLGSGSSS